MLPRVWPVLLLGAVLVVSGCASRAPRPDEGLSHGGARSESGDPAILTSGRFSTRHGTLRYAREYVIHEDGQITEERIIVATDEFAEFYRSPFEAPDGWALTQNDDGQRYTVTLIKNYANAQEFNADRAAESEGMVAEINSPLFRKQEFRATVGGIHTETLTEIFGGHPQATAEDWINFLGRAVTFSYKVTLPAKVTKSSNVTAVDAGTAYEWERALGEMERQEVILVESKRWSWTAWVAGGFLALVVGGSAAIRFTRSLWDPDE